MKVVVVDDTQLNLTLVKHLVRKLPDCEPLCFLDPLEALAWCSTDTPDLLVFDYMMPELDGIELARRCRALHPGVPILMVTANHENEVRMQALQAGVNDFLNKPLNNLEFTARARNMLELRRLSKQTESRAAWLADEVKKATAQLVEQERETIFCLAKAAEYRDPETGAHVLRMAHYSQHLAKKLGLPSDQQDLLLQAAPMHDIGKVGTPDLILLKPGRLSVQEFEIMKEHATIGYEILSSSNSPLLKVAAEIALTHHEKFDGSGYPRGLVGDGIALFGRAVAVADVFDALTSERPYKKAWTVEQAVQMLRDGSGKHFDSACVDAFLTDFDEVLEIKNRFVDEEFEARDRTLD